MDFRDFLPRWPNSIRIDYQVEDRETGQLQTIEAAVPFQPELLPQQGARRQRLARWMRPSPPHDDLRPASGV